MAFTQIEFHLGYPSRSIFSAFSINRHLILTLFWWVHKKNELKCIPLHPLQWRESDPPGKGSTIGKEWNLFQTPTGKSIINCEHSALVFSFWRLTAHYGEMQPWKLDRIRLRIITLNIAYLWHFFLDQNSFGSTLRSLTCFWWVLSWIMVLTEDLLSLRLACIILYLWVFLRLGKKVKDNQRVVVNFWLQDWIFMSCFNYNNNL